MVFGGRHPGRAAGQGRAGELAVAYKAFSIEIISAHAAQQSG
jgi:hypothetical protein